MKGLIIKAPYIDLILEGKKRWEIRGSNTNIRGRIFLIKSGTKRIYGEIDLVDSFEINLEEYNKYYMELYGCTCDSLPYERTYAWVVKNPVLYKEGVIYNHPRGAIICVNL